MKTDVLRESKRNGFKEMGENMTKDICTQVICAKVICITLACLLVDKAANRHTACEE